MQQVMDPLSDVPSAPRFRIAALGCRTNQYEAEAYKQQLLAAGYIQAVDGEDADVCIVNTCTVTESADAHSRHLVRALSKQAKGKMIVTGCYAERDPASVCALPGVTNVIPNVHKETLLQHVFPEHEFPGFAIERFDAHTRAFLKVQDGCNSFCTYCIIPYVRGRSRSRSVKEVVEEAERLIAAGYREIVLTGINVGDFDGGDGNARLAHLVRAVDALPGLERLRISSIDPDEVDDTLLDVVVNGKTTCPSMHIVLQSGSNVILKRMNRKYTRQIFLSTVERLRAARVDFTFTTDVIVGFPGETETDFEETLEVMRAVKFAKVHMFPYSDRPRTRSALMPNKVPADLLQERKQRVLHEAEKIAFDVRQGYVGKKGKVLIEESGNMPQGHTENFLKTVIHGAPMRLSPNSLVEVVFIANSLEGLVGRVV